jgi:glycerophosphoryl diester phosphodiesterase
MPNILNIAHRGASGYCPENTLAAFYKAITLGADFIELDVQKTRDDALVVLYDTVFTDGLRVKDLSTGDLRKKIFAERGIEVPLLSEVMAAVYPRVGINIEIKAKGLIPQLLEVLAEVGCENVIISSFFHEILDNLKDSEPTINTGFLFNSFIDGQGVLDRIKSNLIIQKIDFINQDLISEVHAGKKLIYAWTVNEISDIEKMIDLGVDGIFSDYPDRVFSCLNR